MAIDENIFFDKFLEAIESGSLGTKGNKKTFEDMIRSMDYMNKRVTEANKKFMLFESVLKTQTANFTDVSDVLEEYEKTVNRAIDILIEHGKITEADGQATKDHMLTTGKVDLIEKTRALNNKELQRVVATKTLEATKKFVDGVLSVTTSLVRSIQNDSSGIDTAATGLKYAVEGITGALQVVLGTFSAIASGLAILGKIYKPVGIAIALITGAASYLTSKISDLAKSGIDILATEVKNATTVFFQVSSAGAMFADGMQGLRNSAFSAGLSLETFANIIKNNSESLYESGLDIGTASKRISGVFISGGDNFKRSLFNLGYSMDEQGALIADTMKYLSFAGQNLNSLTDQNLRKETEKYAQNLKMISAITGEDAKKRMEAARQMAANAAVQAELAKMEPEQRRQFIANLSSVPDGMKQAVLQQRLLGTVVDRNAAVLMGLFPDFGERVRGMSNALEGSAEDIGREKEQMAVVVRDINSSGRAAMLGIASVAGVSGPASEVSTALASLFLELQKGVKNIGDTENLSEIFNKLKNTSDPLTTSLGGLHIQGEALKSTLQSLVDSKAIIGFATHLEEANKLMIKTLDAGKKYLGNLPNVETTKDTVAMTTGAVVGAGAGTLLGSYIGKQVAPALTKSLGGHVGKFLGGAVGSLAGPIGTAIGIFAGGYLADKLFSSVFDDDTPTSEVPSRAKGGLVHGPTTGFQAILHGTEAVVPLPDGKTIPVTLNLNRENNDLLIPQQPRFLVNQNSSVIENFSKEFKKIKENISNLDNLTSEFESIKENFKDLNVSTSDVEHFNQTLTKLQNMINQTSNIRKNIVDLDNLEVAKIKQNLNEIEKLIAETKTIRNNFTKFINESNQISAISQTTSMLISLTTEVKNLKNNITQLSDVTSNTQIMKRNFKELETITNELNTIKTNLFNLDGMKISSDLIKQSVNSLTDLPIRLADVKQNLLNLSDISLTNEIFIKNLTSLTDISTSLEKIKQNINNFTKFINESNQISAISQTTNMLISLTTEVKNLKNNITQLSDVTSNTQIMKRNFKELETITNELNTIKTNLFNLDGMKISSDLIKQSVNSLTDLPNRLADVKQNLLNLNDISLTNEIFIKNLTSLEKIKQNINNLNNFNEIDLIKQSLNTLSSLTNEMDKIKQSIYSLNGLAFEFDKLKQTFISIGLLNNYAEKFNQRFDNIFLENGDNDLKQTLGNLTDLNLEIIKLKQNLTNNVVGELSYINPNSSGYKPMPFENFKIDELVIEVNKISQAAEDIKQAATEQVLPLEIKRTIEMSNNSLKEVLREQIDLMRDSNDKFQRLMDIASDTRNINQQILNTAY